MTTIGTIDEQLAELHRLNDEEPEVTEEAPVKSSPAAPTVETPEPVQTPAPALVTARTISLDDVLPDDDDLIPPTLRKKTLRELAEDRKRAILERDKKGEEKNDFESENLVLKKLNAILVERLGVGAAPPAPTPEPVRVETSEEIVRREGIDAALGADPALALGRAMELAGERVIPQVDQKLKAAVDPIAAKLAALEQREQEREAERRGERIRAAHRQAGQILKRDPSEWASDQEIQDISGAVRFLQLPDDDPHSYVMAAEWNTFRKLKSQPSPPAPAPVPTPAPVVAAPSAPAPPVGTGAGAAPSTPAPTKLNVRDANNVSRISRLYPELPKDVIEQLATGVMEERNIKPRRFAKQ